MTFKPYEQTAEEARREWTGETFREVQAEKIASIPPSLIKPKFGKRKVSK
jgi:hypothetical protein